MIGRKTGGRTAGTPNKATHRLRSFLDRIFTRAFSDPTFEQRLTQSIIEMSIDTRLLALLLAYYVGRPPQSLDMVHSGTVSLAELICGRVPTNDIDDPAADAGAGNDVWDSARQR